MMTFIFCCLKENENEHKHFLLRVKLYFTLVTFGLIPLQCDMRDEQISVAKKKNNDKTVLSNEFRPNFLSAVTSKLTLFVCIPLCNCQHKRQIKTREKLQIYWPPMEIVIIFMFISKEVKNLQLFVCVMVQLAREQRDPHQRYIFDIKL